MSILEKLGNLFNKAETIPQIDEVRNEPMIYTSTCATLPKAGDILLAGTDGDVLMADNSGGANWRSLPSAGLPRDKYSCPWCGGYTFDDYLGQCAACGGPRDKPIEKPMLEFNPIGQHYATSGMSYSITTMCSTCEPIELGIRFR